MHPDHATTMLARDTGFLVRIDQGELLDVARDCGVYVSLDRYPGMSLVSGTPIGSIWSSAGPLDREEAEQFTGRVARALHIGTERTAAQDIGYGLRQLTDVANKALSPGINDPTTAVHALGHISALLCEIADHQLGPELLGDDDEVRVVLHRPGFAELLDVAITQPRRYGSSDPQVMLRMFELLDELTWHTTGPKDRAAVRDQLDRLAATVSGSDFDSVEQEQLERIKARTTGHLTHLASGVRTA